MLSKFLIGAAASLTALAALPSAAAAGHPDGYGDGYYGKEYYDDGYDDADYGEGYDRGYRGAGYDEDYGYRDRRRYRRCGSGGTGAVIGGAAGALLGREIARSGRSRYRWHGHGGGTGAIIGGAVGALVGREIARSC